MELKYISLLVCTHLKLYFELKNTFAFPSAQPTIIWFSFGCHKQRTTLWWGEEDSRGIQKVTFHTSFPSCSIMSRRTEHDICDPLSKNPAYPAFFQFFPIFKLSYLDDHYRDMNDSWYSTSNNLQLKESHARSLQLSPFQRYVPW